MFIISYIVMFMFPLAGFYLSYQAKLRNQKGYQIFFLIIGIIPFLVILTYLLGSPA